MLLLSAILESFKLSKFPLSCLNSSQMFCKGQGRKCTWKCFVNCKALCQWTVLIFRRCPRTLRSCRFNFNNWTAGFSKEREFPSPTDPQMMHSLRTPCGRVASQCHTGMPRGLGTEFRNENKTGKCLFSFSWQFFFSFQSTDELHAIVSENQDPEFSTG